MKIVIFGTSSFYEMNKKNKDILEHELVGFLDNDQNKIGKILDGKMIYAPSDVDKIIFDKIFIMSSYVESMKKQLLELGIPDEKIYEYPERKNSALSKYLHSVRLCLKLVRYARKRKSVMASNNPHLPSDEISVVFIIQSPITLDKVISVYEAMDSDRRFRVHFLCVPREENHGFFDISLIKENKTFLHFSEKGYSCINALNEDRTFFDLRKLEPDYCIYVRPYNHFLPKCYRSNIVASYSKVCLITYGALLWTEPYKLFWNNDFESFLYCNYIQDKEAYSRYKKKYSLFSDGPQCLVAGLPVLENFLKRGKEIEAKSRFSGGKIKIVWTPRWSTDKKIGGSNFLLYKDAILQYCERHNSLHLVIRPHPLMFTNFVKTEEMSKTEADDFKQYCADSPRICLDMSNDYVPTFWQSDVLVTDFSSTIIEYFITGKPIIYCVPSIKMQYTKIMKKMLRHCYCVSNEEELLKNMDNLVNGHDPKKADRRAFADKMIEQYADGAAKKVLDHIVNDYHVNEKEGFRR